MQIEYSFLRSRVARRVFVLFILCALLPVGVLSLVAFTDVTSQLTQQSERRVRQESKAMGMAVYQRLLLLEAELLSISNQPRVTQPQVIGDVVQAPALPATPGFTGMARISADGTAEVFLGEMRTVPSLSPAQWTLLRQQKTVMMSQQDAGGRRLFLARLPDSADQAILAEIRLEYVWDLAGSMTLPADMFLCVFGNQAEVLFCSQPLPEELRAEWAKAGIPGRASLFEWHDAGDSYIAGSWDIPLRFQFSAAPWTVVMSESQRSVLAPLASFRYRFILVVVIALQCVALLSVSQIRKTMVPLEQLGEGTRRIAKRNFSTPVQVQSGDEFESLASSFNAMASRLNQQFTQLATIHEIDRSVLSVLDPSRIVDTVLTRLREVSPCEGIAVLLMDSSDP
ncbi:MAG TPA: HAMP domain-containing protein, partial [Nitrospira sp.]|nr:HAMP domain-containing protein [Nitrospira sp.]